MTYTHLTPDELIMIDYHYHKNIPFAKIVEYLKPT